MAESPSELPASLIKAGESLLLQAIDTRREVCRSMVTTSAGALATYLTLVGLALDKSLIKSYVESHWVVASTPVFLFLLAATFYISGFYHSKSAEAVDLLDWLAAGNRAKLRAAVEATLKRRWWFLLLGNTTFWLAAGIALIATYHAAARA